MGWELATDADTWNPAHDDEVPEDEPGLYDDVDVDIDDEDTDDEDAGAEEEIGEPVESGGGSIWVVIILIAITGAVGFVYYTYFYKRGTYGNMDSSRMIPEGLSRYRDS